MHLFVIIEVDKYFNAEKGYVQFDILKSKLFNSKFITIFIYEVQYFLSYLAIIL